MKSIKNKKTTLNEKRLKFQGEDREIDYKNIIEMILDLPPKEGFTPKDLRDRNRIQVALDNMKEDTIKLEDADFENLSKLVAESHWPFRDKQILEFLDTFEKK